MWEAIQYVGTPLAERVAGLAEGENGELAEPMWQARATVP